jgi:hypothetical protein
MSLVPSFRNAQMVWVDFIFDDEGEKNNVLFRLTRPQKPGGRIRSPQEFAPGIFHQVDRGGVCRTPS